MENAHVKRIVFLCSGGGGNLSFIYHAIQKDWIANAKIIAVLTDRKCAANIFADAMDLQNACLDFSTEGQKNVLEILLELKPDLIITTVHKILGKQIVQNFQHKLINLHYSLLPAFGGLIGTRPVTAALEYGAQFTGVTVHWVDEAVDAGKPIVQGVIPLKAEEKDFAALMNVVFRSGCIALMLAINLCLQATTIGLTNSLVIQTRNCFFSSAIADTNVLINESLWQEIALQACISEVS